MPGYAARSSRTASCQRPLASLARGDRRYCRQCGRIDRTPRPVAWRVKARRPLRHCQSLSEPHINDVRQTERTRQWIPLRSIRAQNSWSVESTWLAQSRPRWEPSRLPRKPSKSLTNDARTGSPSPSSRTGGIGLLYPRRSATETGTLRGPGQAPAVIAPAEVGAGRGPRVRYGVAVHSAVRQTAAGICTMPT